MVGDIPHAFAVRQILSQYRVERLSDAWMGETAATSVFYGKTGNAVVSAA